MNGDAVLFSALAVDGVPQYGFACTACGRHQADQPDTVCASCVKARKPAKSTRRRVVKSRA